MSANPISGRVWLFGDNVDTDIIIPARYLVVPDPTHWATHVMEPVAPDFAKRIQPGDVIVAGENFGCGSSREHAAIGLRKAGISAVIAKSVARIFFRNALNNGLPAVECPEACKTARGSDQISVDLATGRIINKTQGQSYVFRPLPGFMIGMLQAGGLVDYILGGGRLG